MFLYQVDDKATFIRQDQHFAYYMLPCGRHIIFCRDCGHETQPNNNCPNCGYGPYV